VGVEPGIVSGVEVFRVCVAKNFFGDLRAVLGH